jgi:hypothetical protein
MGAKHYFLFLESLVRYLPRFALRLHWVWGKGFEQNRQLEEKVEELPIGTSEGAFYVGDMPLRNVSKLVLNYMALHLIAYIRMFFEFSTKFDLY